VVHECIFLVGVSQLQIVYRILQHCKMLSPSNIYSDTSPSDTALVAQVGAPTELFDSSEELAYSALI
jgi:hypothetical protein